MPKSITFFSRGKTPIYVNYVIAHNTCGAPAESAMFYIIESEVSIMNDERLKLTQMASCSG